MKRAFILAAFAAISLLGLSCSEIDGPVSADDLIPRKDIVLTKAQAEFVKANNSFALDLFRQVAQADKGQSLLISPLSVTIDFGMVNNGAVGQTQREIYETLGYKEGSVEGLNDFCQTMMEQSAAVDPSTTLEIANASVINKMYPGLKDSFTKTVKSVYDAEVIYKDFSKDDIRKLVNDWCDRKTHGMIPELLKKPVSPGEYAHFLNAVYFKGIWSSQFKKDDTKKETFTCDDGSKTTVRMMHQKNRFSYGAIPDLCTAVSLPYGNQAYSMTLLLPLEGKTLSDLVEDLNAETWGSRRLYGADVDVKIPSFESEYFVSLSEILQKMGIRQAFGVGGSPDFSAMTTAPVFISDVLHKAKIKVDESGSEAAAVTDIVMEYGLSGTPYTPPTYEFHADRPFLYIITEVSTEAIYFIGQYTGR
jgi:serpin B